VRARNVLQPVPAVASVIPLPVPERDAELVEAARAGDVEAVGAIFERHHAHVRRVLTHVLGPDTELEDLVQEVFVGAYAGLYALESPDALRPWLGSIAALTARNAIRRRARRRWLVFLPGDELPDPPDEREESAAPGDAARAVYRVLERMPADERVVFALRFVSAMELLDVAAAMHVSLATVKRRLARAHARFLRLAEREPELVTFIREGSR